MGAALPLHGRAIISIPRGDIALLAVSSFFAACFLAAFALTNVVPTARLGARSPSHVAQQMRSNSASQGHANHHAPALVLWCNPLVREGSWCAL